MVYDCRFDTINPCGAVAQLGESRVRNAEVGSSVLLGSTNLTGDQCPLFPKADVQIMEIRRYRGAAFGRGCVKTPEQAHARSRLQTQRETLLTGLRADNVLLVSN